MAENPDQLKILSASALKREFERLPELLGQEELFRLSQAVRTTADYSRIEMAAILTDNALAAKWRFAAMYCLLVRARHYRDFDEFRSLAYANRDQFREQPAMLALLAEADAFFAFTRGELRSVIEKCRRALKQFDGVGLKFLAAEKLLEVAQAERSRKNDNLLAEAESYVDDALAIYPRMSRYLAVKAQVLARRGDFPEARRYITDAISLEDSTHPHYYIRLAKYESVRSEVVLLESSYQLTVRLEDAIRDFDQTKGSLIEIVGLLAAVLALVIAGTQIAIQVKAPSGAGLLMIVGGILLISFAGYSLLLGRLIKFGRILTTVLFALCLIGAGAFFTVKYM